MTSIKNFNLLRPFNLELAKEGELLTSMNEANDYKMLDFSIRNSNNKVEIDAQLVNAEDNFKYSNQDESSFRMKPLTWIDGKPVYKGDVLWYRGQQFCIEVQGYNPTCEDGLIGIVVKSQWELISVGEQSWAPFYQWQWDKPKQVVKRKVWINVYSEYVYSYFSKEEADTLAGKKRIACVETKIEYEV